MCCNSTEREVLTLVHVADKVLERGDKIELLVDKSEQLRYVSSCTPSLICGLLTN